LPIAPNTERQLLFNAGPGLCAHSHELVMDAARAGSDCEVAVIGAGPYGLAVAAHLKVCEITTRVFGRPMAFWHNNMPIGMKLQSPWHASHIAHPLGKFSLAVFAHQHALPAPQPQQPLEQFLRYGEWFSRQTVPDLERLTVRRIEHIGSGFCLALENGETVHARRVVLALGLAGHEFIPPQFSALPRAVISHSSSYRDFAPWRGRSVAVIGRGQSACETAALLHESGSEVEIICRGEINWATDYVTETPHGWHGRISTLLRTPAEVGPAPLNLLNEMPDLEHRTPQRVLSWINRCTLRPRAASWLKPRLAGVRIKQVRQIRGAKLSGMQVVLQSDAASRVYDHVFLATGYKADISNYKILAPELRSKIACADGSPLLAEGFESTVPGLHFAGPSSVASYGPLMRFIAGTAYAARSITQIHLLQTARARLEQLSWRQSDFVATPSEEILGS
jgi:cation diffusion facilitator CzcD-associated flavoprotein CzcO